jgi:hypothetical protein
VANGGNTVVKHLLHQPKDESLNLAGISTVREKMAKIHPAAVRVEQHLPHSTMIRGSSPDATKIGRKKIAKTVPRNSGTVIEHFPHHPKVKVWI